MANKILLFVSAAQALAAHWRGGKIARCAAFAPDEEGLAAFAAFLGDARGIPALVVADTVEEDYRYETLPHATGSDRTSLLERKFRQYYRNTRFVTSLLRGRVGDKRRDDRHLFCALTNPALVDPWLAVIDERGATLAGIFLSPLLTAGVLSRLGITTPRVLVAVPHRAGLRLTFYKDGEFCSSRLTRALPRDAANAEQMLLSELTNTRLYLSTLHLDAIDEPLSVVLLDADERLASIASRLATRLAADGQGLDCTIFDRSTLLRRLGTGAEHLDLAPETLYLPTLATKPPAANLAPTALTAGYQLLKRKVALYATSAAVGLAGILWSSYNLWRTHDLALETESAARHTATAQAQYKEIAHTFPAAPTGSENLIKAVQVYQQVVKSVRSPQAFMHLVSRALEPSPEIYLQELNWQYGAARAQAASGTAPAPPADDSVRQVGTLSGEIRPFYGDFRAAIASINTFAERLARDPAVADVRVGKLPLNVNPEQSLAGDTRDAAEHSGNAEFKIEITLKPDA